jgi:ribonuclease D
VSSGYRVVDSKASLEAAIINLRESLQKHGSNRLYLDTEFESNRSGTTMCLLQISAGDENFLFDPLSFRDLSPLGPLLSEDGIEWVLHAGLQDVDLIAKALRISPPKRLFDTQIAWSLLTAEASVGLAYLQFILLGVRTKKGHQADDWVRRPLQDSQLRYAATDVEHLPRMTELLLERAESMARVAVIYAASHDALSPLREPPPPLNLASFRNAWQLGARSQAGLLFLIGWYNALPLSERRHAPEHKALLSVASRLPENIDALGRIKGVPRATTGRYGHTLVEGLKRAAQEAQTDGFIPIDPPPYCTFEEIKSDAWFAKMRAELSISLEFSPEFVLPQRLLKRMKAALSTEGLDGLYDSLVGWRRQFLLSALERFCSTHPPPV